MFNPCLIICHSYSKYITKFECLHQSMVSKYVHAWFTFWKLCTTIVSTDSGDLSSDLMFLLWYAGLPSGCHHQLKWRAVMSRKTLIFHEREWMLLPWICFNFIGTDCILSCFLQIQDRSCEYYTFSWPHS